MAMCWQNSSLNTAINAPDNSSRIGIMIWISAILDPSDSEVIATNPPFSSPLTNRHPSRDSAAYYFFGEIYSSFRPSIRHRCVAILSSFVLLLSRRGFPGGCSSAGASPRGADGRAGRAAERTGCIKIYTSLDGFKTRRRW